MQDDEVRTCAVLGTLRDAILACPPGHDQRWKGHLVRLGKYLRDNPVAHAALDELRRDGHVDEESLRECSANVLEQGRSVAVSLGEVMLRLSQDARREFYEERDLSAGVAPRGFRDFMRSVERGAVELTIKKLSSIAGNVLKYLGPHLERFVVDEPAVSEFLTVVESFQGVCGAAYRLQEADELMRTAAVHRTGDRLIHLANAWRRRFEDPAAPERLDIGGLKDDAPAFVDMLIVQVKEGVSRLYAVYRLRVLFENFMRERLCSELRDEEAREGNARREQVLQKHMDEFLFREGYFPLTHTQASNGFMDTLLLDRATASRMPPLLIELKQAVNVTEPAKIKPGQVESVIKAARGEVACYLNQIVSRPAWQRTTPIIVVVHTCRGDLSQLDAGDAVLIVFSDKAPSEKTGSR